MAGNYLSFFHNNTLFRNEFSVYSDGDTQDMKTLKVTNL